MLRVARRRVVTDPVESARQARLTYVTEGRDATKYTRMLAFARALPRMRDRHVRVRGATLRFHFRGKGGKEHVVERGSTARRPWCSACCSSGSRARPSAQPPESHLSLASLPLWPQFDFSMSWKTMCT